MREEELKLEKIKKSCNITYKLSLALEIIMIVAAIACVVGGIICFSMREQLNTEILNTISQTDSNEIENAFSTLDQVSLGGILKFNANTEQMIDAGEYSEMLIVLIASGALICGVAAGIFGILASIFKTIKISETPFNDKVLKKLRRIFIAIVVILLLTSGLGEAVFAGLIGWSVYCILDYGFTLQKQFDETL